MKTSFLPFLSCLFRTGSELGRLSAIVILRNRGVQQTSHPDRGGVHDGAAGALLARRRGYNLSSKCFLLPQNIDCSELCYELSQLSLWPQNRLNTPAQLIYMLCWLGVQAGGTLKFKVPQKMLKLLLHWCQIQCIYSFISVLSQETKLHCEF